MLRQFERTFARESFKVLEEPETPWPKKGRIDVVHFAIKRADQMELNELRDEAVRDVQQRRNWTVVVMIPFHDQGFRIFKDEDLRC